MLRYLRIVIQKKRALEAQLLSFALNKISHYLQTTLLLCSALRMYDQKTPTKALNK